ncbi:MAG: hypothetical protein PUG60_13050 [Lachnospiraceae bacterium]|nr:hypothetical protein [Lachnospiraceae bacterium]
MSEKRCLACHSILNGEADCPVCGYPDYIVPNMKPELLDKLQAWAQDHRRSRLESVTVSIYGYSHEMQDGKLSEKSISTVKVCDADALSFDKITWLDQKFAYIDTDEILKLVFVLSRSGGETEKRELPFHAPDLKDFWYIGAKLTEGLGVEFAIGNQETYVTVDGGTLL